MYRLNQSSAASVALLKTSFRTIIVKNKHKSLADQFRESFRRGAKSNARIVDNAY